MANLLLWDSNPSAVTLLTTELNSLANAGRVLTGEIDNSSDLKTAIDIETHIDTQASARSAGAAVDIYLLPSMDGTTFPGSTSEDPSVNMLVGSFSFDATTGARSDVLTGIVLPPGKHKILLKNNTGQAFAASGNTLKYRVYAVEVQ